MRAITKRVCCLRIPNNLCNIYDTLRERQHFTDREWLRIRQNTEDGKCLLCVPPTRSQKGMRKRRMCLKDICTSQFVRCTIKHGQSGRHPTCDERMRKEEEKVTQLRERNAKNVQISTDGISTSQISMDPEAHLFVQSVGLNRIYI